MMPRRVSLLALALAACAGAPPAPPPTASPPPALAPASGTGARYGQEPEGVPTPGEAGLLRAVRSRLGAALVHSGALSEAAREVAARRAAGDPAALSRSALRLALARAAAHDDSPSTFAACSAAPALAEAAVVEALPASGFTHAGVAVAGVGDTTCAVVVASRRRARLEPFPRDVPTGARVTLRGRLVALADPSVHVSGPSGRVHEVAVRGASPFAAEVLFDAPGRWRVEVVGRGPAGPQVAALLLVSAGGAPLADPRPVADEPDPPDDAAAEARVLGAVNRLRASHGLPWMAADDALREAARRQSAAMLATGTLAHVLPGSADVGTRLRQARVPFRRALENLARAGGALEAQASLEESPAHLGNLLDPEVGRIGVGIARGRLSSGDPVLYLTQILVQAVDDASDSRQRPQERVRESLWRERERLGRPPLLADPALDAVADRTARTMLRTGQPEPLGAADEALALGRGTAAADAFVASSPADAIRSRNLADARLRRVGVGVAIGDSPRFGAGLLWIAVVYSD